jgi:hypothetical protein
MSNPIITIYDASTNSQFNREMTDEEHAQYLDEIKNVTPLAVSNE